MKPAAFEYHAPETVADVASLLAEYGDDAKVLAGGQSLVPLLAMRLTRFPHIVDLNRVDELRGIERQNGHLTIRAMTRQAVAEHDATVAAAAPLVAKALPMIGHFQIRNRGTVGGSIAHADPASELPGGRARARRRARGRPHRVVAADPGGRLLRGHLDHHTRAGRGAHRGPLPGVGGSVRLRRRRDRAPQRRLRARRCGVRGRGERRGRREPFRDRAVRHGADARSAPSRPRRR